MRSYMLDELSKICLYYVTRTDEQCRHEWIREGTSSKVGGPILWGLWYCASCKALRGVDGSAEV